MKTFHVTRDKYRATISVANKPNREPDIKVNGFRLWVDEGYATYADSYVYAVMQCAHTGLMLKTSMGAHTNYEPLNPSVQKAYQEFIKRKAESILIGVDS